MKKALITGGAGFIGYHLALHLSRRGYSVDLFDNFGRDIHDSFLQELIGCKNVNLLHLNLQERTVFDKLSSDYNIIYHIAETTGVKTLSRSPYDALTNNLNMLQNVIDLCRRQLRLERLVFTSTSEVYSGTQKHFTLPIPTPETTPLTIPELSEKRTPSILSKIYGEALCLHSGLPVTIVRPHNFYGPGMGLSSVVPELLMKALLDDESDLRLFSPDHRRTFCYIDDAVEMMSILSESKDSLGEVFNVGNQEPEITIRVLAEMILTIAGAKMSIKTGPVTEGCPVRRCPDMSKTRKVIGYNSAVSLEDGLKRTFEWYKMNVFLNHGNSTV